MAVGVQYHTAVPDGGRSLPPFTTAVGSYFLQILDSLYILILFQKIKYIF
jgi:hypothetical protein